MQSELQVRSRASWSFDPVAPWRIGFERPDDVLKDPGFDGEEKRAALACWPSQACAVESRPAWRLPGGKTVVPLAEILQRLEAPDHDGSAGTKK